MQLKHIGFDFDFEFVQNKGIGFYFGFERRHLCILVLISQFETYFQQHIGYDFDSKYTVSHVSAVPSVAPVQDAEIDIPGFLEKGPYMEEGATDFA